MSIITQDSDFKFKLVSLKNIPPLTYKHIENSLTKKGEMGSSHVNLAPTTQSRLVEAISNIN